MQIRVVCSFSYISYAENVNRAFVEYMQGIADMIKSLGINTELSGRNDILVEGKKGCRKCLLWS